MTRNQFKCYRQTTDGWQPVGKGKHGEHVAFDTEAAALKYARTLAGNVRVFVSTIDADGRTVPSRIET